MSEREQGFGSVGPGAALRQEDEVRFAAVSVAPEQPAWAVRAGTGGTIEIAFANGVQLRITGAVDPATLTAAVAAVSGGRARCSRCRPGCGCGLPRAIPT